MKKSLMWFLGAACLSTAALAQHADKEIQEDISRHRAMAAAHEAAAKCLESGKGGKVWWRNFRPLARVWRLASIAA